MKLLHLSFVLLLILSCDKNDASELEPESTIEKGLLENQNIMVAGQERNYHLYIPENPTNASIVLLFHGNRSNNDEILGISKSNRDLSAPYKVWLTLAEQENIILIIPNGTEGATGNNGWNDCRTDATSNPTSNDVLFSNSLIDFITNKYNANTAKVFAIGTSNGGHMAMRLAQEIPNKLTAFAAIVASNPVNSLCTASTTPISALFMNGTDDPINPIGGGNIGVSSMSSDRGEVFSIEETIASWVSRNETNTTPIITDFEDIDTTDNCTVKKQLYTNGLNNTEVAFYEIVGGGHTEPSITERYSTIFKLLVKEQNGDIEMANEVWNFFKTK